MITRHSNQTLVAASFAAVFILVLADMAGQSLTARAHADAVRKSQQASDLIQRCLALNGALSQLVADERGYLQTGDPLFGAHVSLGIRHVRGGIRELAQSADPVLHRDDQIVAVIPLSEDVLHQIGADAAAKQLKLYDSVTSAPEEIAISAQAREISLLLSSIEAGAESIKRGADRSHKQIAVLLELWQGIRTLLSLSLVMIAWFGVRANDRQARQAQGAEVEARRKFELLFQRSNEAFILYNDHVIVDCNAAAARLLGYQFPHELIGVSVKSLLVSALADGQMLCPAPLGDIPGGHRFECVCRTRDGRELPMRMSLTRIKGLGETVIMASMQDLTEAKRSEALIRADRERYARIANFQDAINAAGLDLRKAMEIVGDAIMVLLGAEGAHVALIDGEYEYVEVATGLLESMRGATYRIDETSTGECIRLRQPVLADEAQSDRRINREIVEKYGVRSMLALPLFVNDQPSALVKAASSRPNAFAEADIRACSLLANMLARTISRARDYEAIQQLMRERSEAVVALREREAQLLEAQHLTHSGNWTVDIERREAIWSDEIYHIGGLGDNADRLTLDSFFDLFVPEDAEKLRSAYAQCLRSGQGYDFDLSLRTPAGALRHVHAIGRAEQGERGKTTRLYGTVVDITDRKQVEQALRDSQERYRLLFDDNPQPMWVIDVETTRFIEVNAAALQHYGYTRGEFLSMSARDLLVECDTPGRDPRMYIDHIATPDRYWGIARHKRRNGSEIDVEILSNPTTFVSGRPGRLMLAQDVTARLSAESQIQAYTVALELQKRELQKANLELEALATTDGLTGVKNHRAFQERFAHEFKRATRYDADVCLVMMDVDLFKAFNDDFGHPAGDEVLMSVAGILCSHARDTDLVARYGGEEFAVILPGTSLAEATAIAERMKQAIQDAAWPSRLITASFGVSSLQSGAASTAEMISLADQALYQAKLDGRNRVRTASPTDRARAA